MNNGRVRKSPNTLIRAYKKKKQGKKYYFTMYRSEQL